MIKTVRHDTPKVFDEEVNLLLKAGYKILSTSTCPQGHSGNIKVIFIAVMEKKN